MSIAEAYRRHRWRATPQNVKHGNDQAGVRVDTPDVAYQPVDGKRPGWWRLKGWNVGVPYQWGGFDTLAEFEVKLKRGYAAGDVYSEAKRTGLDRAVSAQATGIDCSGFISRCWRLERSYSTRELPGLCEPLLSYDDLRPGDILNTHNAHVLLFAGWETPSRTRILVYDTGSPPSWRVLWHPMRTEYLRNQGYRPWRYRGIRD